jgi:proteasome accessory factor B
MNRTERLLDLIAYLVNAGRPVPLEDIREAFPDDYGGDSEESSRRKFERDKAELVQLGIPLRWVPPVDDLDEYAQGGYVVDKDKLFLPELKLSPEENAVLYLAGMSLLEQPGFPYREALELALRKMEVRAAAPAGSAGDYAARVLIDHFSEAGERDAGAAAERLRVVEEALARRKRLRFRYLARYNGQESERVVDPYGLFCRQGHWTLVGRAHERDAVRVFLLHRMRAPTMNPQAPATPDFEVPASFVLAEYADVPAWRYDLGPSMQVELEVREAYAWLAEAELRAPGQPGEQGWRRHRVETTNPEALIGWVLGMGDKVRVTAPAELRERVRARLSAMLESAGGG